MFLKSPHKLSFSSMTFAAVLSTQLLFSNFAFADAKEFFDTALASFNSASRQNDEAQKIELQKDALRRFFLAFQDYPANSTHQAAAKLFMARSADFLKETKKAGSLLHSQNCTNPVALYQEAIDLYNIAEKDADLKNGLADAYYYQAENTFARGLREDAKKIYQSSLDLKQSHEQKVRTGKKLAQLWMEDKDNQKAKECLIACLDSILDPKDKALTQKKISEFYFEVKKLDETIQYGMPALLYFEQNIGYLKHIDQNPEEAGQANSTLQDSKYLKGLYAQSIAHGEKAKAYYTDISSKTEDHSQKEKLNNLYIKTLNLLGQSYLSLGDIVKAKSEFTELNNYLEKINGDDMGASVLYSAGAPIGASNELLSYKAIANLGLAQVCIAEKDAASANSFLALAKGPIEAISDSRLKNQSMNLFLFVNTAIKFAFDNKRTNGVQKEWFSHNANFLANVSEENAWRFAKYSWRLNQSFADLEIINAENIGNWTGVSNYCASAIEIAQKAGYLDLERISQEKFALAHDQIVKILEGEKAPLDAALQTLKNEKGTLTKEKISLEKELRYLKAEDEIQAKQSEIASKTEAMTGKDAEIVVALEKVNAKANDIAEHEKIRNAANERASRLELGCEFRQRGWMESKWDPKGIDALPGQKADQIAPAHLSSSSSNA